MTLTAKNGKSYNTLVWTAPIKTASGKLIQVLVIFADVTQLRQLQDHLSTIGLMISSISHGIKGVLTSLDAGLYLIDSGFYKNHPAQIEEGLEVSKLMAERIRKLVLDILYYAKERELKPQRVSALRFACDIAATVDPKIRGANIEFVCDFDRATGEFEVDTDVIRSAIINILENAVEACIEDSAEKQHKIVFTLTQKENQILFEIVDNAIGIKEEEIEKLFTMFYSSKGHKGTGLGLFIADKVIRQHGGRITVHSTPGEGSQFKISIPKNIPENAGAANGQTHSNGICCPQIQS
jgi:signal transduction histidine kinase